MTPTELVLIDTCVWVPFFNRPQSAEKAAVDGLLDEDRATLIGPILAEVLQGFRRNDRADWVASSLRGLHYVELPWEDWCAAAQLGRGLAAHGHRLPLTDRGPSGGCIAIECGGVYHGSALRPDPGSETICSR